MSILVYKNARLLVAGHDIAGELHDLSLQYGAEMLDVTTFGNDTKIFKGGLSTASMAGTAHVDFAAQAESLMWADLGVSDVVVTVFPNGITEGVACGYSMLGIEKTFNIGGTVGSILQLKFDFDSRGISVTP